MNGFPVIALLVLLPAVGAIVVGLLPKSRRELILPITTAISMLPLAVALYILWTTVPPIELGTCLFPWSEGCR